MGLMPLVSSDLSVSEPQVGHLVSIYALGVVVGAPLCALVGAKFSRKNLLISLMVFYSVSNAAIALVEGYEMLLVFRFVAGLPHGAFFGIAALLSASLVNKNMRAKAVSFTMMGLTLALLIGNPLASLIGQNLHWRYVFAFISVNALITVLLIYFSLPIVKGGSKSGALSEVRSFNNPAIWYPLAIGSIDFAGMFCVLSYLAPTLLNVTNVSPIWIPIVLFVFGLGGFLGNILGGWLFDRLNFYSIGWILFASVCRSEEHTSELQSRPHLVCRLLLEKKKKNRDNSHQLKKNNIEPNAYFHLTKPSIIKLPTQSTSTSTYCVHP